MADKYSTIQQHQPLRVPTNWGKQEKSFVMQLEEILDDIYRRYGRLGMDDMSKSFKITINGKYDKVSGITIDDSGVEIVGNKSVDIMAGTSWWRYGDKGFRYLVEQPAGSHIYEEYGFVGTLNEKNGMPISNGIEFTRNAVNFYNQSFGGVRRQYIPYISIGKTGTYSTEFGIFYISSTGTGGGNIGSSGAPWGAGYFNTIYYGTLTQSSSRSKKHNIFDMKPVGEKLDLLKPVNYVYDNDPKGRIRSGLIYEDTKPIMPEICTDEGEAGINYLELVPMLLKEVQDLRKRVAVLEGRA